MRERLKRAWFRYRDEGDGPIAWAFIVLVLAVFAGLATCASGCRVFGEKPQVAVVMEADRQLIAAAKRDAEVVLAGSKGGGHQATTRLLEGVVQSLSAAQAGPIGVLSIPPWPADVVERVAAELRCEPVVRVEADPSVLAALDAEKSARAAEEVRSREAHGELETWKQRATAAAAEAAGKWGLGTVVTGGGGLLAGLVGFALKNRKRAQALYAYARAFQEVKHDVEAGKTVDPSEVIIRHAGANGARAEIDAVYERVSGKRAEGRKPSKIERARAALKKIKLLRKKKPRTPPAAPPV